MPYGPQGQWRPADPMACVAHVMKIATGEIEETYAPPRDPKADHAGNSRRASKAAKARAAKMTSAERIGSARHASLARRRA